MHSTVAVAPRAVWPVITPNVSRSTARVTSGRADASEESQCAEPGDEQARAHPEDVDAVGDHALGDPAGAGVQRGGGRGR
jgi:hypothetical protein